MEENWSKLTVSLTDQINAWVDKTMETPEWDAVGFFGTDNAHCMAVAAIACLRCSASSQDVQEESTE